jgi:predicted MFS family arabinose efflux permease
MAVTVSQGMVLMSCAGLALARSTPALAAASALAGFASTLHKPASAVVVARKIPASEHVRAFGLLYWATNIGAGISPAIAGVLLEASGYWLLVLNSATAIAYSAIAIRFPGRDKDTSSTATISKSMRDLISPCRTRAVAQFLVLSLFLAMIYNQKQCTLPLSMAAHHIPPHTFGLILSLNGILVIIAQPTVSRLAQRLKVETQFLIAALLVGLGFGANVLASQPWMYATTLVVWTAGEILLVPQASAFLVSHAPTGRIGAYQASYNFTWNLGLVLGAPVGDTVLDHWGSHTLWTGALILGLVVAGVQTLGIVHARRHATSPTQQVTKLRPTS